MGNAKWLKLRRNSGWFVVVMIGLVGLWGCASFDSKQANEQSTSYLPLSYLIAAETMLEAGNLIEAADYYRRYLKSDAVVTKDVYDHVFRLFLEIDQIKESKKTLRRWEYDYPSDVNLYVAKALIYFYESDWEQGFIALDFYQEVENNAPYGLIRHFLEKIIRDLETGQALLLAVEERDRKYPDNEDLYELKLLVRFYAIDWLIKSWQFDRAFVRAKEILGLYEDKGSQWATFGLEDIYLMMMKIERFYQIRNMDKMLERYEKVLAQHSDFNRLRLAFAELMLLLPNDERQAKANVLLETVLNEPALTELLYLKTLETSIDLNVESIMSELLSGDIIFDLSNKQKFEALKARAFYRLGQEANSLAMMKKLSEQGDYNAGFWLARQNFDCANPESLKDFFSFLPQDLSQESHDWESVFFLEYLELMRLKGCFHELEVFLNQTEMDNLDDIKKRIWMLYRLILMAQSGYADELEENYSAYRKKIDQSNDPLLLNTLAYAMLEQKQHLDDIKGMLMQALEYNWLNHDVIDNFGWLLYQKNELIESLFLLELAYAIKPMDEIAYHLGVVYFESGDLLRAKQVLLRLSYSETGAIWLEKLQSHLASQD